MKILATSPLLPRPDTASGDRRFAAMLRILSGQAEVHFASGEPLPASGSPDARYVQALEAHGIRVVAGGAEAIHDQLARTPYHLLFAEFWTHAAFTGRLLRRIQPWARLVTDTVDVHFLREEAAVRLGLHDAAAVQQRKLRELAAYREADAVVTLTADDETALREAGVATRFARIPNIVEPRSRPRTQRPPRLLFVGGFGHPPNLDAVLWFVNEIFPLVRQRHPEALLRIVGAHPPQPVLSLHGTPGIEVVSSAPEIAPHLDASAVSIAPLRYGAGMKGKVTEALACGVPVVTTGVGAQGLHAVDGRHLRIADSPDAFAQAIVECLENPDAAEALGKAGSELILGLCGEDAARRALDELLAPFRATSIPPWAPLRMGLYRTVRALAGRRASATAA